MEFLVLLGMALLALPFVLPLIAWFSARNSKRRLDELERIVERQSFEMAQLSEAVRQLGSSRGGAVTGRPAVETPPVAPPVQVAPEPAPEVPRPGRVEPAPVPLDGRTASFRSSGPETVGPNSRQLSIEQPRDRKSNSPRSRRTRPRRSRNARRQRPRRPRNRNRCRLTRTLRRYEPAFDWESLVGVKLFSAVAGIALVLAAVFFLRYSIESGWLQPPVRVTIGVIVAVGLLIVCERKAARRYPVTANALDAAAVAILFSTFFSAHALWNLIPATRDLCAARIRDRASRPAIDST